MWDDWWTFWGIQPYVGDVVELVQAVSQDPPMSNWQFNTIIKGKVTITAVSSAGVEGQWSTNASSDDWAVNDIIYNTADIDSTLINVFREPPRAQVSDTPHYGQIYFKVSKPDWDALGYEFKIAQAQSQLDVVQAVPQQGVTNWLYNTMTKGRVWVLEISGGTVEGRWYTNSAHGDWAVNDIIYNSADIDSTFIDVYR